ncbi:MAG: sulfatase [Proteiniphilum sp.]
MNFSFKTIFGLRYPVWFVTLLASPPVLTQQKIIERPNILLILSDDHSFPYLGCYGNSDLKTPNIDKIAKEGIRFNRAYTTAPQSVPSRASIMTGRNVLDVEMLRFTAPLDKNIITGPEILRSHGYYTGLCGRTYHLDGPNGPKATLDVLDEYGMVTFSKRVDYLRGGGSTVQQFSEFLDQVPKGKPFFMQACFSDPHRPFTANEYEPDPKGIEVPYEFPDTKLLREDLSAFYGEIQRLDYDVGLLIKELHKRGLDKNTLIVFMGDNGSALLRGKGTLYESGINVPLLVKWPGVISPGTVSDILVSGEDLVPTFLDAAKIIKPDNLTGISFYKALRGGDYKNYRKYVFAVRGAHASGLANKSSASFDLSRVIIENKYKLIYNPMYYLYYYPVDFGNSPFWIDLVEKNKRGLLESRFSKTTLFTLERPIFELFDLEKDPFEFNNLSGLKEFENIEHELKKELQEWMILYQDIIPLPITPN